MTDARVEQAVSEFMGSEWGEAMHDPKTAENACKRASLALLGFMERAGVEDAELWCLLAPIRRPGGPTRTSFTGSSRTRGRPSTPRPDSSFTMRPCRCANRLRRTKAAGAARRSGLPIGKFRQHPETDKWQYQWLSREGFVGSSEGLVGSWSQLAPTEDEHVDYWAVTEIARRIDRDERDRSS